MDAVQISNVTKTLRAGNGCETIYRSPFPKVRYTVFIGPNGSGKTTTMRMIVNIFYPDSGTVRVFGKEKSGPRADLIGYLPEERGLYRQMPVQPLLEFYAELRGGRKMPAEITAWLQQARSGAIRAHAKWRR